MRAQDRLGASGSFGPGRAPAWLSPAAATLWLPEHVTTCLAGPGCVWQLGCPASSCHGQVRARRRPTDSGSSPLPCGLPAPAGAKPGTGP